MSQPCPKLGYRSKVAAKRAVRRIQTNLGGGRPVHFYRCPRCREWHWTRQPQHRD